MKRMVLFLAVFSSLTTKGMCRSIQNVAGTSQRPIHFRKKSKKPQQNTNLEIISISELCHDLQSKIIEYFTPKTPAETIGVLNVLLRHQASINNNRPEKIKNLILHLRETLCSQIEKIIGRQSITVKNKLYKNNYYYQRRFYKQLSQYQQTIKSVRKMLPTCFLNHEIASHPLFAELVKKYKLQDNKNFSHAAILHTFRFFEWAALGLPVFIHYTDKEQKRTLTPSFRKVATIYPPKKIEYALLSHDERKVLKKLPEDRQKIIKDWLKPSTTTDKLLLFTHKVLQTIVSPLENR